MDLFKVIGTYAKEGKKGAVATIVKRMGAAPREVGAKMFVGEDGSIHGSVGGGCMEADVFEEAKRVMAGELAKLLHFRLDASQVEETGMICGGNVEILLEPLLERHREIYSRIAHERRKGLIVRRVEENTYTMSFVEADGSVWGDPLPLEAKDLEQYAGTKGILLLEDGTILEAVRFASNLFVFGAGHVSLYIAKIAKMVDFNVTVIDDREEFANKERFPEADRIIARPFEDVLREMEFSRDDYVVIVTRGHRYDAFVLEKVLGSSPGYVGMIGSQRKVRAVFDYLLQRGLQEAALRKVYAPVGLDINAETPQEIAVSIVAQLIQVRGQSDRQRV